MNSANCSLSEGENKRKMILGLQVYPERIETAAKVVIFVTSVNFGKPAASNKHGRISGR